MKRVREEFLEIAAFLGRVTPVEAGRGME
jgi:hypothetical protein